MTRTLLLPLALFAVVSAAPARAEVTKCTAIGTLPATITSAGVYCLNEDRATAITGGAAITVAANNVVIDCNDRRIGGLAAGAATDADGIIANNRQNVTIRNCVLRGFRFGIYFSSGSGHLVENNRIDNGTFYGMAITGDGHVVRGNRVLDIGGRAGVGATGISFTGSGSSIVDNIVSGVMPAGPGDLGGNGILVSGSSMLVADNHVTEIYASGEGNAIGIAGDGVLRGNTVSNSEGTMGYGIVVGGDLTTCADNIVNNFYAAGPGCTKVGYNVGF